MGRTSRKIEEFEPTYAVGEAYEKERLERIEQNRALLAKLGLINFSLSPPKPKRPPKRQIDTEESQQEEHVRTPSRKKDSDKEFVLGDKDYVDDNSDTSEEYGSENSDASVDLNGQESTTNDDTCNSSQFTNSTDHRSTRVNEQEMELKSLAITDRQLTEKQAVAGSQVQSSKALSEAKKMEHKDITDLNRDLRDQAESIHKVLLPIFNRLLNKDEDQLDAVNIGRHCDFKFVPESPCKLVDFLGGVNYTPSQDNREIFNRSVGFFRKILTEIEMEKRWEHFKFFIIQDYKDGDGGFSVGISRTEKSETNKVSRIDFPSTANDDSKKLCNIWFDAKARPMFIITPVRHVERLSECTDDEIFSIFHLATQIIDEEMKVSKAPWEGVRFLRMILNHGNSRNIEHLHLKVTLRHQDFKYFKDNGWDGVKKQNFRILEGGLYKRDERLQQIT
ncbi:12890_t:CDS:2 [Racocetra fulgida]|uniref:12890_t:CDS:1 n=1 Tax=Racocetra fulgida TaxID=60492 RepID=A0A9N9F341_9GLOM|nr:12890_t:CDS:2 [Racocetra fulgida]